MDTPFSTKIRVRIGDINYGNHMGNDRFLLFFQEARLRFLETLSMSEVEIAPGIGLIMTEASIRYLSQVSYGEELAITVSVSSIQKIRFILHYEAVNASTGNMAASGETTLAAFDYTRNRPVRLPDSVRAALSARLTPPQTNPPA